MDWTSFGLGAAAMLAVILVGYWLLNRQWLDPNEVVA